MQETINLLWLNFVANQQIFLHYITEVFLIKWLQLKQNQIFAIAEKKPIEGGQKICSPQEGQTLKKTLFKDNHIFQKHTIQKGFKIH